MTSRPAGSASRLCFADLSASFTSTSGRCLSSLLETSRRRLAWARGIATFAAVLMLLGAFCVRAQAVVPPTLVPNWHQLSPATSPPGRSAAAMTYDAANGTVVLFGGFNAGGYQSDTWVWNGTNWTDVTPNPITSTNNPPARAYHAMAYDATSGQVVLFGGYAGGNYFNDTWVWNGTNWTSVSPANSPSTRIYPDMATDPSGNVVLFGGDNSTTGLLGDTWEWNGTNWIIESPGTSPSARENRADMTFDAQLRQVVLFGGDGLGGGLGDTWEWNGTNWTNVNPATSPTTRTRQAVAYNPTSGETVLFGGLSGTTVLTDTWEWNGTTWTNVSPPSITGTNNPSAREYHAMASDPSGQTILFGGDDGEGNYDAHTWELVYPVNFGNVNVCSSGAPAPCSNSLTLTYSVSTTTDFGTPQVVMQGAGGLNFLLASGSTCIGTVTAPGTCTVNATFTPGVPGMRQGAVELFSSTNSTIPLLTTLIYGTGEAPLAAYSPLTSYVQALGGQTVLSPHAVAVDASDNLFIANTGVGNVVEVSASDVATVVAPAGDLNIPFGVAEDGAGDIFIADYTSNVVEIPAGCTASTCWTTLGSVSTSTSVAVDAAGDVFIGDQSNRQVVEVPANGGPQITVYSPGGGTFEPGGLAVDSEGDVYIADSGDREVLEIPAGSGTPIAIGSGWSSPQGVALDAAGDLYVADSGLKQVVEIPAGCSSASCQMVVASASQPSLGSGFLPYGVAVDSRGTLYIADYGLNRVDTVLQELYGLSFSESSVGNISGDSPESITLQNIGNQALNAISPGLVITNPSYYQVPGSGTPADCSATFSLAPSGTCNVSIDFDPLTSGLASGNSPFELTGYAIFDDNSLNNSSSQSIALTGQSLFYGSEFALTVTEGGSGSGSVTDNMSAISCSESSGSVTGSCSGNYASGAQVTLTAGAASGSTFVGWGGGACASAGTVPTCVVTMSQAQNVSANFAPGNFGSANVCPAGAGPAPCSATFPVTFNFTSPPIVAEAQALTDGAITNEFEPNSFICTGNSCTVSVTFRPQAPGVRRGAVQLLNGGTVVATQLIYGIGQAAQVAFGPTVTFNPPLTPESEIFSSSQVTEPPNLAVPLMTDAAGNLYQVNGTTLQELAPPYTGSATTVATGFTTPVAGAIDGAGNLYVADSGVGIYGEVVKLAPGCASLACASVLYAPTLHPKVVGVAVDGLGDVFIADNPAGVLELPAGGSLITLYSPGGNSAPQGVAVDGAGNVFVADPGLAKVVEIPPGCTTAGCQFTVGSGWGSPASVAVDAAGDVIVADYTLTIDGQGDAGGVVEVPAGCTTSACQILLLTLGAPDPYAVTASALGQLFVASDAGSYEINQSQPPAVSFGNVNDGLNAVQTVTLQNIGNEALNSEGASGVTVTGTYFLGYTSVGGAPYCNAGASFQVAPGQLCDIGIIFEPTAPGAHLGTALITDNALNGAPATQTINLTGIGVATSYTIGGTVGGLAGSGLVLQDNLANNLSIISNGAFTFPGTVTTGTAYSVSVLTQPSGPAQNCTVTNGGGAVGTANVTNVLVSCTTAVDYTLSVTVLGTGSGTVTDNWGQIGCSAGTCSASYASGTAVILTASANAPSIFVGWGGACASAGASALCNVTVNSALNVTASFVAPGASQSGILKPITAGVVYGQGGSFTSNTDDKGGVSTGLADPAGSVLDSNGNLYVGDTGNNRVLFYPAGSTTPTRVYGQGGSLTTNGNNQGGLSANSLNNPYGVALDSSGNLYVCDMINNRVLFYPSGSTTATGVYGQGGSFTTGGANNGGVSANSLNNPYGVAVDSSGNLYVADQDNNRVLFYPAGSTTATRVYGQGGSFTSNAANNGGVSANSLHQPLGLALDSSGDLYVGDTFNNRVLFYPFGSTTATQVYGQGGSFGTGSANNGGVSANSLYQPFGVSLDSSGDLYIGDTFNNRVLFYSFGSTTATRVYGQLGSFTINSPNPGGVSANSLEYPEGVPLDSSGNLYVADYGNNRVVEYGPFGNVNVCPAGQSTPAPCNRTVTLSYNAAPATTFGAIEVVTQGTPNLDFTPGSGSTCTGTSSAGGSCTVNVNFTPLAPGLRMGEVQLLDNNGNLLASTPAHGIGQAPEIAFGPGVQSTVASAVPGGLVAVAEDGAGDIFIADSYNSQVIKVPAGGGAQTTVGSGLSFPYGVAVDGAGDVFIADANNGRVVEVPSGCTNANCQTTVASGLNRVTGIAVDGAGDVFVSESDNGQVLKIPSGCDNASCQTIVVTGLSNPIGIALDGAGDLFIANLAQGQVVKVPAGCTNAGCQTTVGSGLSQPYGVAVDGAGDVFIADENHSLVVEVPVGCTSAACQTTVGSGLSGPEGVAVDGAGHIFIADTYNNRVVEVNRSQPPSFSFALTSQGSTSTDSPHSVAVQNVGNQPLTVALSPIPDTNFVESSLSACGSAFTLAPGAVCYENFSFTPQSTGYLTDVAYFSDNTLNLASSVVAQAVNLSGVGDIAGQAATVIVPNVVGMTQANATAAITGAGLALGSVSSEYSSGEPAGSAIGENPAAGTLVSPGSAVKLLISVGEAPPPTPNPLTFENNYFVTGDYASAGVTLRGTGVSGMATGTITIPSGVSPGSVPNGADIIDAFLYWQTVESTPTPSANTGTFFGYSISGTQIGSDLPYTDSVSNLTGTLRAYRADVNTYFPIGANGVRFASGSFPVSLPDGRTALPLTEGASLVVIYRVLVAPGSTNPPSLPLKAVVIYDGSVVQTASTTQNMQGFYDSLGAGESTALYSSGGSWSNNTGSVTLGLDANQYSAPLNNGSAYVAQILSTPVNNSDNDGILNAWKAGPGAGDFFAGQPGYYEVKTQSWVGLPGALHGEQDLFVQLDWMCGAVLSNGSCDPTQENLYPSPDANGNDPLAMVQQAFLATGTAGIHLHLEIGNAVAETTCADSSSELCQFPGQPGVIGWKNSLEFSKVWPRNFTSCASGGDCTARFPYGQKDSYHYVLFGHSLAIPAWNSRFGSLTGIQVASGTTTITTTGIPACPSRITISGVLGNPTLNGVYNTTGCTSTTMTISTPAVPSWTYPNSALAEPVIGITSGTVTSISGYSDLGGADSAVSLALWETAPNQNMSKRANVIAGTLFHEIGHTLGLSHGGLYYEAAPSYIPTFDANCKPNYQSSMNYLFQLDGVGPNSAVAFSNQQLDGEAQSGPPAILTAALLGSVYQLTDGSGNPATFSTSAWYSPTPPTPTTSAASLHCDGTPLNGDTGYRVNGSIAPITPAWTKGQNITFDGVQYGALAGYNDVANIDLRQVGATGGEFASLASVLSFGSSATPLNVAAGGTVALGSGGTVALGSGGTVTLGSGGNVTLGSGGTITPGSGGSVTLNNGGSATLSSGGTITLGSGGNVTLGSVGNVTLGSGGTITLGSGGNVTLGSGGNVTLGSGGTIALGSGGTVTIPAAGGSYLIDSNGGTITLGSGGNVTLGSGGNVTLGSGGTIAMGSGGNVTLGSGGNVTLGSGGTIALGSGGNVTLGSGGNVTLGSGGTIALGSGGNVTLGSGGNVTLGSGGNVTMGSGGNVTLGSGGNVTLGSGGTVTLGSGGNITLGSGGNVTLGSGGTITSGGSTQTVSAGTYPVAAGGTITLGSGGNITLGSGGNVTLGSGGVVALGSGGNIALGSGGTIALGSGGNVTLGSGGVTTTEMDYVTANSVVRPPPSATYTLTPTTQAPTAVTVNWMAPAFGVVQTYTISRSDGVGMPVVFGPPVVIGSVSGVNGNPPATTFTDTTPPSGTLVYTISTTLLPVTIDPTQRQSAPSPPAVLTINQNIVLGALPSVTLPGPQTVTATAETNGVANGLRVSFSATGPCSIGSQSPPDSNGVSSASVTLSSTGSCAITASQAGTGTYNAASPASGTFMILPAGSNTTSQTITFTPPALQSVQYGNTFSLSASSSSGLSVSLTASGPCTTSGTTSGVGVCKITASQAGNNTYSPASVTQSFNVTPAVLKVTANNPTIQYGQAIPSLAYAITGYVNNDPTSVVSGTAALSTTATTGSAVGSYPITVSTGTLSAANYSFLYVNGTLTIQMATPTVTFTGAPTSAAYNSHFAVAATTNASSTAVITSSGACSNTGTTVTMTSGTGTCSLTATWAADSNYSGTTASQSTIASKIGPTVTFTGAPISAAFHSVFTVAATTNASSTAVITSSGACSNTGTAVTMTSGTGSCSLLATWAADNNYNGTTANQSTAASKIGPTVTFTGAPTSAAYKSVFTVAATTNASSTAVITSIGACSNTGTAVTMTSGTGSCSLTATWAPDSNYSGTTASQSTIASKIAPTVTFTGAPSSAAYNSHFTVAATTNASSTAVVTSGGACSNTGTAVTMTSGTGSCSLLATWAADGNYSGTTASQSTIATLVAQAITFTTNAPSSAAYNSSFTVAAAGGASGNALTFTSSGACSNSGATYTMTNSTGTCSVIANQAGNSNYAAATPVTQTVNATGPSVTVAPSNINFGTVNLGSITTHSITVTNVGTAAVTISEPLISIVKGGNSNEFVAVSLCPASLAAGKSCTITIAFVAGPYYTPQTATLEIMDNAPGSPQPVTLTATVLAPQTITFTTNPPASAAYNSSFTVAATGGASGNAVIFTSSGMCSNSGATYTLTSGTGTCSVIANQAGNSSYAAAAQVTKAVTATPAAQTIAFTTNPPASGAYKSTFTVAATGGGSGNAVTFTSSGACSNSGATYTMTSSTGTCSVIANQAGNSNYAAAAPVTKTVSASPAAQTIAFTTNPPTSAAYKSSFAVAATGGASGNAVTFTSSGSCSNSGATYTMTSGTGTCSVIANQAGNSNYSAATPVTKTVSATLAAQTIAFTTNPPASAVYKSSFTVAATGGASGNAVTFTSSGACSNSGATYTITSTTGTCSVIVNQAGNSNYSAATPVTKTVNAT